MEGIREMKSYMHSEIRAPFPRLLPVMIGPCRYSTVKMFQVLLIKSGCFKSNPMNYVYLFELTSYEVLQTDHALP